MKKLVVAVAALGLIGIVPAQAHKAEGVRCRARIIGITYEPGDQWQVVETRLRVTNLSDRVLKPEADAGLYDLHGPKASDDEWLIDDELPAHKLKPGETQRQHSLVNVDPASDVDEIRIDHCHRSWYFDD